MLTSKSKVVCCCAGGQVRSVAARKLLMEHHCMPHVLACGLEKNGPETLEMLFQWADAVLVVGELTLAEQVPAQYRNKVHHLDIGPDVWRNCFDPELRDRLVPLLKEVVHHGRNDQVAPTSPA